MTTTSGLIASEAYTNFINSLESPKSRDRKQQQINKSPITDSINFNAISNESKDVLREDVRSNWKQCSKHTNYKEYSRKQIIIFCQLLILVFLFQKKIMGLKIHLMIFLTLNDNTIEGQRVIMGLNGRMKTANKERNQIFVVHYSYYQRIYVS